MRSLGNALEQLLLPAECLLCRRLLPAGSGQPTVCAVCAYRWRAVRAPWCARCGQPGPHFGLCRLCAAWPRELTQVRSAVWLDPSARRAVHALKYQGLGRVAGDLAHTMERLLPVPHAGARLVPVPLSPDRQRARGYNQSARLAAHLSREWSMPMAPHLLARVRRTRTQTALTPEARLANVAGAFEARTPPSGKGSPLGRVPGQRSPAAVVLVDDVFTTGATVAECARALAAAGWEQIIAVTFGRAVIPDFT